MNIQPSPGTTPIPNFQHSFVSTSSAAENLQKPPTDTEKTGVVQPDTSAAQEENQASDQSSSQSSDGSNPPSSPTVSETSLTESEKRLITELKQRDMEVKRHEMAHISASGGLAVSGANFTYQRGPDGRNYAVGGEVSIDTSPVSGDPEATVAKMQQVRSAALAPADPSAQDMKVAARASAIMVDAVSDIMASRTQEQTKEGEAAAFGSLQQATQTYTRVHSLPEEDTSTIHVTA